MQLDQAERAVIFMDTNICSDIQCFSAKCIVCKVRGLKENIQSVFYADPIFKAEA